MAMIVTCDSCRSRFQLDEALLKGAKGARIRCRRCGGIIVLLVQGSPEMQEPEPPPMAEPEAPREEAPLAPIRPGRATSPPVSEAEKVLRLEDLFLSPQDAVASTGRPGGDPPVAPETPPQIHFGFPHHRRHSRFLILLASCLSVLLMAGAAYFYLDPNLFRRSPAKALPVLGNLPAERPSYEIRDAKGYFNRPTAGQSFFVVRGTIANVGKGWSDGIRVRASLLGADNEVISESESFAGNLIEENLLPHMTRVRIEEFLGMRYGEGNVNRNIQAGGSLPFMVVFFDPPEPVESFTVIAMDAEETPKR
jgi:predicted Zn finger-like uncharacterized protein